MKKFYDDYKTDMTHTVIQRQS